MGAFYEERRGSYDVASPVSSKCAFYEFSAGFVSFSRFSCDLHQKSYPPGSC